MDDEERDMQQCKINKLDQILTKLTCFEVLMMIYMAVSIWTMIYTIIRLK